MDRRTTLKQWMDEHERGTGWVASKTGYSKQWISYVLNGHKPFSDKLARALQETLGVQFNDLLRAKQAIPTKRPRVSAKATKP
jgi:cyanate lyase